MSDKPGILTRIKITVRALLKADWQGAAGHVFRETVNTVSEYTKEHVKPGKRLEELPDVLWDSAKEKSSRTLVNIADEEQKRIASELSKRTLTDKVRQEKATADRLESEARLARIREQQAKLEFIEKLKIVNVAPIWNAEGRVTFAKVPANYDWDGLTNRILLLSDFALPEASTPTDSAESEWDEYPPPSQV